MLNVKNWVCGTCKSKILGKIHSGNILIIQHKGLHLQLRGEYDLESICPLCGAKNNFRNFIKNIEAYIHGE